MRSVRALGRDRARWFAETQFLPIRLSIRLMDKQEVRLLLGILAFSILIGLVAAAVL